MNAPARIDTLPEPDSTADITDAWNEVMDPGNAQGGEATALFIHAEREFDREDPDAWCGWYQCPEFIGMRVQIDNVVLEYTRDQAEGVLGRDEVNRIEAMAQAEALEAVA